MNLLRSLLVIQRFVLVALAALAVASHVVHAQAARPAQRRLLGLSLTAGATGVPKALITRCGSANGGGALGLDGGAALLVRPWRSLVLQADLRVGRTVLRSDCTAIGVAVDTAYPAALHQNPYRSSIVRLGVETPRSWPLVRATAGVGRVWGNSSVPLTAVAIGAGSRGAGARFLVETERQWARVHAEERVYDWDTPRSIAVRPVVVRPVMTLVRVGFEFPLMSR
jgi:hypothetical protein